MGFLIKLLKSARIYLMMYSSSFQVCNYWTQVTMTFNVEPTMSLSQKENHVKKQIQVSWDLWLYFSVLDEHNLCMYVSVQQAPHAFQYKEEFVYGLCENLSHLKANLWLSSSCTPNFTEPPQNCSPNAKTCLIWLSSSWATTAIFPYINLWLNCSPIFNTHCKNLPDWIVKFWSSQFHWARTAATSSTENHLAELLAIFVAKTCLIWLSSSWAPNFTEPPPLPCFFNI